MRNPIKVLAGYILREELEYQFQLYSDDITYYQKRVHDLKDSYDKMSTTAFRLQKINKELLKNHKQLINELQFGIKRA